MVVLQPGDVVRRRDGILLRLGVHREARGSASLVSWCGPGDPEWLHTSELLRVLPYEKRDWTVRTGFSPALSFGGLEARDLVCRRYPLEQGVVDYPCPNCGHYREALPSWTAFRGAAFAFEGSVWRICSIGSGNGGTYQNMHFSDHVNAQKVTYPGGVRLVSEHVRGFSPAELRCVERMLDGEAA